MKLARLRASLTALALSVCAWAAGCGTPQPMMEPVFAARTYTPARIALLPPAVFMVYDQYGDNDPQRSAQLGQAVSQQTMSVIADELRRRGYDVNLQARWDGVYDGSGQLLVPGNDLAWLANSIVMFANSELGGGEGTMAAPAFVAPELARRVGWATQSDSMLYVNMKGVAVSQGKRTAQVVGTLLFVVVIAAIVAVLLSQNKNGGGPSNGPGGGTGVAGRPIPRAGGSGAPVGGAMASGPGAPTRAVVAPVQLRPGARGRPGLQRLAAFSQRCARRRRLDDPPRQPRTHARRPGRRRGRRLRRRRDPRVDDAGVGPRRPRPLAHPRQRRRRARPAPRGRRFHPPLRRQHPPVALPGAPPTRVTPAPPASASAPQ
jgi:hypothetical protein